MFFEGLFGAPKSHHEEPAAPVPAAPEAEELTQDNVPDSERREREMEVPESFDPEVLLQDERIEMGPSERAELLNLLTNFGANTAQAEERAALIATDLDKMPAGEHEALGALKERRGERPHYGSIRPLLFLVGEYLAGRDGSPLKFDGTRNVMFSRRDDVAFSVRAEKDWAAPQDPSKTKIVIDVWGKGHGPLVFNDKTRFITAKK